MQRHGLLLVLVPDHHAAQTLNLRWIQRLHASGVGLREVREPVALDHVPRIQILQRIRADQDRAVREGLQEVHVVHVLVDDDLHHAAEQRAVGFRSHRHPVVGPIGGRVVLGRDHHDAGAALDTLQLPVSLRHLVLNEVFAPAGVQLAEAHVVEVVVRCLHTGPERVGWVLVAVPGVVRPIAAALRLVWSDLANPAVQQRQTATVEPGDAHLADDAEDGHAGPMLEGAGARALHHLDHFRWIALLTQPPGTCLTAVPLGDDDRRLGQIGEGGIPGHAQHVVQIPPVEFIFVLHLGRQLRGAVVHPLLPPTAHQRTLQPIWPVHSAMERVPLQAHPRVVSKGSAVAVEVFIGLVVVILLDPHHDAVPNKGAHATAVRVVRGTAEREGGVVTILVMIDPLPGPVWIIAEGVAHLDDRLKRGQGQGLIGNSHCRHRPGRDL